MNTEMAEPQVTRRKRTWLLVAACMGMLALIAWFTGALGSRRPATILRDNAAFENAVSRILNKLPSGPRDSLRKLKFRLFGPPKMLTIDAKIVNFYAAPAGVIDKLGLERPVLSHSDGLKIWIVPNQQIATYQRTGFGPPKSTGEIYSYAQMISAPRVTTFSGHPAQMAITATTPAGPSGYTVELLPRVRNEVTDLSVRVQYLDPPGTNTLVAARLNLPKDSGAIVLRQHPTNPTNTIGIFLEPALLQIKK